MTFEPTPHEPTTPASESMVTVIIAFAMNILVAVAKTVAAAITGSASMVAESAHSWPMRATRCSC